MKKINEIFYSLQGEGANTGTAAVFIRFSGCNLKCSFCDTKHEEGVMMSDDEIVAEVLKYPQSRLIVLTGGEPLLFISEDFVEKLKSSTGMNVAIETNGTHELPSNIDWVTFSPKQGFEGGEAQETVLTCCDELKVVYVGQNLDKYFEIEAKQYYLQPCYCDDVEACGRNQEATIEAVKADPRWRLSLQTHKMLDIR